MIGSETFVNGDENIDFDWSNILNEDDFFFAAAGDEGFSNPSPDSFPLSIEDLLMKDDDALVVGEETFHELPEDFFSDLLLDAPANHSEESGQSGELVETPDSRGPSASEVEDNGKRKERESSESNNKVDDAVQELDDGNDDPIAKKRKRQLRNRDAAIRSRERKKLYVRDLELKSKYFESECKRLGIMLQCCLAENQALRLSLQNSKAVDASMPRQESAVLLLESLLLGSLLWFLGIICLFILPPLPVVPQDRQRNKNQGSLVQGKMGSKTVRIWVVQSMMGKKYKASKSRMKSSFNPAEIVF